MVNFVFPVRTADGGTVVVYTGDRWMQAPDGKKAHEPQFWTRLEFDSTVAHIRMAPELKYSTVLDGHARCAAAAMERYTLAIELAVPQPQFPPTPAARARVPT